MTANWTRRKSLEISAAAGLTSIDASGAKLELTWEHGRTLLAMARQFFRHEGSGDGPYYRVLGAIAWRCQDDPVTYRSVTRGLAALDSASGGDFSEAESAHRTRLLTSVQESDFYRLVYCETLKSLYGSPNSLKLFSASPREVG